LVRNLARISSAGSNKRESYKVSLALQPEARGGGSHRVIQALINDCFSLPSPREAAGQGKIRLPFPYAAMPPDR
jgi:hypothetical protein